jgi:kumamolisin
MRMFMLAFAAGAVVAVAGCSPGVPSSPNPRVAAAIDLGKLSPDAQLDVVVGLAIQQPARLGKFLADQPETRDALTPYDFADRYSVSPAEYTRVTTWLRAQGLIVTQASEARTTISLRGPAANFERAFSADMHRFSDGDGEFVAALNGWTVAPDISASVSGVIGLGGDLAWKPHYAIVPDSVSPRSATAAQSATDLEALYKTTAIAMPGSGETVVILGAGLAPAASDVTTYFTNNKPYGLTASPATYNVELVGGANRDDMTTAQDEQQENTLDIEMVQAIAPYANVVHVITATNTPGLFADGIAYIINKHSSAHQVSVSYGTCERGAAGVMPVMNAMFQQARAEGQTWFFAAGDTGTDGCRDGSGNKIVSAGYPASSPFVVGVGGTQLTSAGVETTWDNWGTGIPGLTEMGAGGGGASESQDKPDYQQILGSDGKTMVTPNDGARDEPDVSALAGPPFINIEVMGVTAPVAGTSAAAPMWAAVWSLVEQGKSHTPIVDMHTRLYTLGAANATNKAFNDVNDTSNNGGPTETASGGYPSGPGFDLATGWGSPNVPNLIAAW